MSHETRLVLTGNHAHHIVETLDGKTLTNPLPQLYGKQPFYIPYWKQIKSLKEYIKYGLKSINKSADNYGIIL